MALTLLTVPRVDTRPLSIAFMFSLPPGLAGGEAIAAPAPIGNAQFVKSRKLLNRTTVLAVHRSLLSTKSDLQLFKR
jgi:hypothetical protein